MSNMIFVAVFTANQMIQRQRIMRATPILAAVGMFSLWQRTHENTPLNSPIRLTGNAAI